ncbi:MAG: sigma-70 family RNA polymerase sigma factor [Planctomycetia bacterium]|nr:sigma-70 family RNA polymerase sigma factor [Planctomycetia bacterium]
MYRALLEVHPTNKKEFFALAATMVRREILDLARKYKSQKSDSAHHHTSMAGENTTNTQRPWEGKSEPSQDQWLMFHEAVEQLNSDEKTLFELRFYQGMDLEQAAETLGISERTARRRWRNARIAMERYLREE